MIGAWMAPIHPAICSLRIVGWEEVPVFNEAPELATFKADRFRVVPLSVRSLDDAKRAISADLVLSAWSGLSFLKVVGATSPAHGIDRLEVLDDLGGLVAQAGFDESRNLLWDDCPELTDAECVSALEKAIRLQSLAAFEAGWDNFSTARSLRRQADALERKVAITRNLRRLFTEDVE